MGFSAKQNQALNRNLSNTSVRTREINGRELSYIEGWHAIAEANRIFGFEGWDRETIDARCVVGRERAGAFLAVYVAKVRITVRAQETSVVREGNGTGEARGASPGEVHDLALKAAETDATKRALATFGKPFGLSLYLSAKPRSVRRTVVLENAVGLTNDIPQLVPGTNETPLQSDNTRRIDKSALPLGEPRRLRDKAHLLFVASQPCLICARQPADAHHLRFTQPRALGRKVSDEYTVPLCRIHHREAHSVGKEAVWWEQLEIDAVSIALGLWEESHDRHRHRASALNDRQGAAETVPSAVKVEPST